MKNLIYVLLFVFSCNLYLFAQTNDESCPKIKIAEPTVPVHQGESITFAVWFDEKIDKSKLSYEWKVDKGKIIRGQDTSTITVDTSNLPNTEINSTVKIIGLHKKCPNTGLGKGEVFMISDYFPFHEYEKLSLKEELNRFDYLLVQMSLHKDFRAFIHINITQGESVEDTKRHIKKLIKHIENRKAPKEKITFAIRKNKRHFTVMHVLHKQIFPPECEKCEILNASDVNVKNVSIFKNAKKEKVSCPKIKIIEPAIILKPGEPMTFVVKIDGTMDKSNLKYQWKLDKGTIIAGQGTSKIIISTAGLDDGVVNANVEIAGLDSKCTNKFLGQGLVESEFICGLPIEDYGKEPLFIELNKFDNLIITLSYDKKYIAYVAMEIDENETIDDAKKHIQTIVKHFNHRKISDSTKKRINFTIQKSNRHRTIFYVFSPNLSPPECKGCEVINAADVKLPFDEIGKVKKGVVKKKFKAFIEALKKNPSNIGYIIHYGGLSQIEKREKIFRELIPRHPPRIIFVRVGESPSIKTVFWIIPAGETLPIP